jgi:L-arabinose isomerase
MAKQRKARVGLLGLMFNAYDAWPELKPRRDRFARKLAGSLSSFADVEFPGICDTEAQVAEAVAGFEKANADLLLVVLLTYSPSLVALPALQRTPLPILIFNTQELYEVTDGIVYDDLLDNHGAHGVQDLTNALKRVGRPFNILTGHYAARPALAELRAWCEAAAAVSFLHQARLALIGHPMAGVGDVGIDETALFARVGVRVQRIAMGQVAEAAAHAPAAEIARQMDADRRQFQMDPAISDDEHATSSHVEWAIRHILREGSFAGWSADFGALGDDGRVPTLPFLAACKLMAEGYSFGGEGDVVGATVVTLMQSLVGVATFTEMFTIDFAHGCLLMSHMGEINYRMARKDEPVRMVRRPFPLVKLMTPVSICCTLEPGPATLVNLTTGANGRLRLIAGEGSIADFPSAQALSVPHYRFKPATALEQFLTRFSEEGASHHHAVTYGHVAGKVEKVARLLNLDYVQV